MQQKYSGCVGIFNKFVQEVSQSNIESILNQAQLINAVRQFKINQLTPTMAIEIYQNIFLKFNRNLHIRSELNWWQNQLRIFVWILVLYVELKKTKIQDLSSEDWPFFSSIFPHKKLILFEYQSINILKQHGQAKKWINQQDQIFSALVNQKGLKCKWSQLAKLLYIQSDKKFFRTPKQCRERWLNHLDPTKSKTEWTIQQDYILIRYVYEKEKRWAQISKLLQNKRNQHSIKNRFKSLITKQQKYHKEKLQEPQLIACIYKRYSNHLNSINSNRIDQMFNSLTSLPSQQLLKNKSSILQIESQRLIPFKQKQQNNFLATNPYNQPDRMFPFRYYSQNLDNKKIEQKSFKPFRKPQHDQFLPTNINDNEYGGRNLENNGYGICSLQQLMPKSIGNYYTPQSYFLPKIKSEGLLLQKRQSQVPDRIKEEDIEENMFFAAKPEDHFSFSRFEQDLPFNKNYSQFLPIFSDQTHESASIEEQIYEQKQNNKNNNHEIQVQNELDPEQNEIRQKIFYSQDLFQILKGYFVKKPVSPEQIQNK